MVVVLQYWNRPGGTVSRRMVTNTRSHLEVAFRLRGDISANEVSQLGVTALKFYYDLSF